MNRLKELLDRSETKTFFWQTMNGGLMLALVFSTEIDWVFAPLLIALLNGLTKHINKNYL